MRCFDSSFPRLSLWGVRPMPFRSATRQPPLPLPAAVLCARVALHLHPMVSPCAAMSSASPGMARFISCPQRRSAEERGRMRSLHAAQELGFDWSIAQRPLPFQSVLARVVAVGHVAVAQPWLAVQREPGAAHCPSLGRLLLLDARRRGSAVRFGRRCVRDEAPRQRQEPQGAQHGALHQW